MKNKLAPLKPSELNHHHFGDTEWKMNFGAMHHLFHINRLEDVVDKIKFPLPPHRKTVFDFIFLTEGISTRSKGLQEFTFSKNTFFFLPAFQISTHKMFSADAKGFFCHFDIEIFTNFFKNNTFFDSFPFLQYSGEPLISVSESLKNDILNILIRLEKAYYSNEKLNFELIISYLLALFNELKAEKQKPNEAQKNAAEKIMERYKKLLAQHIFETNRVTDYAEMLNVTPDHLNKCIKATIGKTSQELLADMVILEAKVMLRQTDLSISEIAFKFSESNPSDFSRFFKNKTHQTPKAYRQISDFA